MNKNQAVKRNIERFCFKLTEKEVENFRTHFVISSLTKENSYGGKGNRGSKRTSI